MLNNPKPYILSLKQFVLTLQFLQSHLSGCDFFGGDLFFLDAFLEGFDFCGAVGAEPHEFFGRRVEHCFSSIMIIIEWNILLR